MHSDNKTNVGGVGIYNKDSIKYKIVKQINLDFNDTESLWVTLEINKCFIIGAVYCHPVKLVET